jgi:hypothetical protein
MTTDIAQKNSGLHDPPIAYVAICVKTTPSIIERTSIIYAVIPNISYHLFIGDPGSDVYLQTNNPSVSTSAADVKIGR